MAAELKVVAPGPVSFQFKDWKSSHIFIVINGFLGTTECPVIRCVEQALNDTQCSHVLFNFPAHGVPYAQLPGPSEMVKHLNILINEVSSSYPTKQISAIAYSQGGGILYKALVQSGDRFPMIFIAPAISLNVVVKNRLSDAERISLFSEKRLVKDFGLNRKYTITNKWLVDYETWENAWQLIHGNWAGIIEAEFDTSVPADDIGLFHSLFGVSCRSVIAGADHVFAGEKASTELRAVVGRMIKVVEHGHSLPACL